MIIKFKTHFPWQGADGQPEPTHFKEQIANCLADTPLPYPALGIKKHTLRRIKNGKNRFRPGMKLQMATGSRFKPEVFKETVCSSWLWLKLDLVPVPYGYELGVRVCRDGKLPELLNDMNHKKLALNDGFRDVASFNRWFLLDLLENGPGNFELVGWGKAVEY